MNHQEQDRLEIFEMIDEAEEILKDNMPLFEDAKHNISSLLEPVLYDSSAKKVIGIKTRLKSPASFKEKIIRRKLYQQAEDATQIITNMTDIVGIMIECRFIADEADIYNTLCTYFNQPYEDGYSTSPYVEYIRLNLSGEQPQKQKNGHDVYRVDGIYETEEVWVRFELQIKSMVNAFWSEIEHEMIYKNNKYRVMSDFVVQMLNSVKNNLIEIDNMLMLLSSQMGVLEGGNIMDSVNVPMTEYRFSNIMAKAVSDYYISAMHNSIGFTTDFKRVCEIVGHFIVSKYSDSSIEDMRFILESIMTRFRRGGGMSGLDFESRIVYEETYEASNRFCEIVGTYLYNAANNDFEWHVFFKLFYDIEKGNHIEVFTKFMNLLYDKYASDAIYLSLFDVLEEPLADRIKEELLECAATAIVKSGDINIIHKENEVKILQLIRGAADYASASVKNKREWEKNKQHILDELMLKIVV
jgi:ppGpp synthetase/RelA/SpoT-type nucleotidyltranferase